VRNKEAFLEIQSQMVFANRQLGKLTADVRILEREKRKVELTQEELAQLPSDAKSYKSVGRTFFLVPKNELKQDMAKRIGDFQSDISEVNKQKAYIEKKAQELEKGLKELILP